MLISFIFCSRSRWPRGLRPGSATAGLLGLRGRIPPEAWFCLMSVRGRIPPEAWFSLMSVFLSGRGLCGGPIPRSEESYLACALVFVSLSMIRCSSNTVHVQWVGITGQTKRERMKEMFCNEYRVPKELFILCVYFLFYPTCFGLS